jgi:hypothetical protein
MRRGRRDAEHLRVDDTLDCWRMEALGENRLRLVAEMKLPRRAWLEFAMTKEEGGSRLRLTAMFDPMGVWGLAYWYGVWPLHQLVFAAMLRGIIKASERKALSSRRSGVPKELARP